MRSFVNGFLEGLAALIAALSVRAALRVVDRDPWLLAEWGAWTLFYALAFRLAGERR